jgi:hypothetical protein
MQWPDSRFGLILPWKRTCGSFTHEAVWTGYSYGFIIHLWGSIHPQLMLGCRCYALLLTRTVNTPLELYEP